MNPDHASPPGGAGPSLFTRFLRTGRPLAAGIHLSLSVAAVGTLAALMILAWYPQPYFMHDGGWYVLRLILGIDVVLGPLLTLVVFDRAKQHLKRDLAMIALMQVGALIYGAVIMVQYRPAFVAELDGVFYTVTWPDLERGSPDSSAARELAQGAPSPLLITISLPDEMHARARLREDAKQTGIALIYRANLYAVMTPERMRQVFARSAKVPELAATDPLVKRELDRVLQAHGVPLARLAFVPMQCRYGLIMLVFDRETGARLDWMI